MTGEPGKGSLVWVGPPLFASAASIGSPPIMLLMLVTGPLMSASVGAVLPATIVFRTRQRPALL